MIVNDGLPEPKGNMEEVQLVDVHAIKRSKQGSLIMRLIAFSTLKIELTHQSAKLS